MHKSNRQNGAVLIVSLLVLLLLTLLGLTAIQAGTVQEKIAGNTRNLDLAFQAAEAALRAAEGELERPTIPATTGATPGWYHWSAAPAPAWKTPANWDSSGNIDLALGSDDGWSVGRAPEFVLEELPPLPDVGGSLDGSAPVSEDVMFRISARGFGANTNTFVILQTTYRR